MLGQNHARLDDLVSAVLGVLAADNLSSDETLVEYISSVLRDGLEEEDASGRTSPPTLLPLPSLLRLPTLRPPLPSFLTPMTSPSSTPRSTPVR